MNDKIIIKGAKQHNLKNVSLELPRNKMIVFTGLSGSGKSSLAFDTIYAEGQRRYVESLSSYARQFLGRLDKPDVEYIEGLSPAISIDQKTTSNNPRSTVGTVTEIYDYLRLLFANIGIPHCPVCGNEIKQMSVQEIVDKVMLLENGTKIQIISPIVRAKKGTHEKVIESIKKDGYVRFRIDGIDYTIDDEIKLEKNKKHDISIIIDRLIIKENLEKRLSDSIEIASNLSNGTLIVDIIGNKEVLYSTKLACPEHGIAMSDLQPAMFSFNNPTGACPTCSGLGSMNTIDVSLVIPDDTLTLRQGAIDAWNTSDSSKEEGYYFKLIESLAKNNNISLDIPFKDLPEDFKEKLLYGSDEIIEFNFTSKFTDSNRKYNSTFEGVIPNLERRYRETPSNLIREKIEQYMVEQTCPTCKGARLREDVLSVTVGGQNISDVTQKSISDLVKYVNELKLTKKEEIIASEILKEIRARATFLIDVGLEYLTLSRKAGTLSGGEAQRIRLATQIGSALVGVLYVLDEPSIGLHQRDNDKLLTSLRNLTDIGNTLIVVEHDEDTMKVADYIVDIGPNAGLYGGEIVACGSIDDIKKEKRSITGQYLSGKKTDIPKQRRKIEKGYITIEKATENNLKNINVDIPLGVFTCVTGVSGSGKSTLVNEILFKSASSKIYKSKYKIGKCKSVKGLDKIDKVVDIDQSPIGRTPRSNPATYTGIFDIIRDVFAMTKEAKSRGYQKGRFSFNVKGGRCEACKGDGIIKLEMHFLPDVYVPCEVCNGKRYDRETLQVTYKDKNIADILDMDVKTALEFFDSNTRIKRRLETLMQVGLSYIKLGQPSTQLSGGEAQRIKLATELSKISTGNTLYILDEPTTGLHTDDVNKLIKVLQSLTDMGNTVVVIEHNLDVIKSCDYIIDLGPEGGIGGGQVVATGTPEEIVKVKKSYTGKFLKDYLK